MAVSRMLKTQILGHLAVKEDVKRLLREAGVIEVTDVFVEEFTGAIDEERAARNALLLERAEAALQFLDGYAPKEGFLERLRSAPPRVTRADIDEALGTVDIEEIWRRSMRLQADIRKRRDELAWSRNLARELEPWRSLTMPIESLQTSRYTAQFWVFSEKTAAASMDRIEELHPFIHTEVAARSNGKAYVVVIVSREEGDAVAESCKLLGGVRSDIERLTGAPGSIIDAQREGWRALEVKIAEYEAQARSLVSVRPALRMLSDHFREGIALADVEKHLHRTDRTFVLEGWVQALDRRRLEKQLSSRFRDVEICFRGPRDDEDPPVALENSPSVHPFEFIMTLYGRPLYREVDPTPLLAPFFVLMFSMCMSDAGYGLVLGILSALFLYKVRIEGGLRLLFQVFLITSVLTIIIGILTGGYFGIDTKSLPPALTRLILINPLEEPMKMLHIAFLIGFIHILFGIGIRAVVHFQAGLYLDAVFDDLLWILFLIALAPLGYAKILGGTVPGAMMYVCARVALAFAAVLLVTGARKEKNKLVGLVKSLLKFYSITGYFGDVLSYARLLALGLAAAAIGIAINGIAVMVSGLPFYLGYVAAAVILILGHAFNLAVNILGAFVHSARLQYLEFFNKFFSGGGREFRPFRSERRYTVYGETRPAM
jgi:V/A-type H+-transporting ATPase subunit I